MRVPKNRDVAGRKIKTPAIVAELPTKSAGEETHDVSNFGPVVVGIVVIAKAELERSNAPQLAIVGRRANIACMHDNVSALELREQLWREVPVRVGNDVVARAHGRYALETQRPLKRNNATP